MNNRIRTYTELSKLKTFKERFEYLKLEGEVGVETFGFDRVLNQIFYRSDAWKRVRRDVIVRDKACDLGIEGYEICPADIREKYPDKASVLLRKVIVHHMNPISQQDIIDRNEEILLNPNYLICCSKRTHNAIHYGDKNLLPQEFVERRRGDTCPWIVY